MKREAMPVMDFLAALSGAMISVMILMNVDLAFAWGNWAAAVVIHIAGLVVVLGWMLIRREKPFTRVRMRPALYLGGALGVLTTVFTNMSAPVIGVSATLALGLLGQSAASAVLDGFGLMGAKKTRFRLKTAAGMALIAVGVAVMLME